MVEACNIYGIKKYLQIFIGKYVRKTFGRPSCIFQDKINLDNRLGY